MYAKSSKKKIKKYRSTCTYESYLVFTLLLLQRRRYFMNGLVYIPHIWRLTPCKMRTIGRTQANTSSFLETTSIIRFQRCLRAARTLTSRCLFSCWALYSLTRRAHMMMMMMIQVFSFIQFIAFNLKMHCHRIFYIYSQATVQRV